jgi:hypothetical protein
MTREEIITEIYKPLMEKIMSVEKKLDAYTGIRVDNITPYTETKTAYIGDTEITFYDVPDGNVTIFFDKPYTMEKVADRITLTFDELDEVTDITISIS